jgi:CheY-like chemotaxis protein
MPDKILVVDDNQVNLEVIKEMLANRNEYEIITATDGEAAIDICLNQAPSLVLLDWKMPKVSGIEVLKYLKQNESTADIPVLIVTAYAQPEKLGEAFSSGAVDFIAKPINEIELVSRLNFALKLSHSMHALQQQNKKINEQVEELNRLARINKEKEELLNQKHEDMLTLTEYLENVNSKLEEQKKEISSQKFEIEAEQQKSEELLLNILPFEVARQLKSKGKARPRHYKMVSVLFTDFKGFSNLSKGLAPRDLIGILDSYFIKFDEIMQDNYLEKIKTIGDAYMCAGGLPLSNKSNPINAVLAGMEVQHYMNQLNDQKLLNNESAWELRLGIHTGEVIAGVVGKNKFAYDVWGTTVNIASRMEAAGEVGMVNISGTTYEYVKEYFDCVYRGKVEAKNIGMFDMYFVTGIKAELSVDGKGLAPNENFLKMLNKL